MSDVLAVLGVSFLIMTLLVVAAAGWLLVRLRRRNTVSRRYRTRAPLHWLVSPGTCARLHRRLRGSVAVVRTTLPRPTRRSPRPELGSLHTVAEELEAHAAGLDRDVLLASHVRGSTGAQLRRRLTAQVGEVERLSVRVAATATAAGPLRPGSDPSPEALAALAEQLDALEAARDERARLEDTVGLTAAARLTLPTVTSAR